MKNCFLSIWLSLSSALLMDQVRQVEVVKRSEAMTFAGFNPELATTDQQSAVDGLHAFFCFFPLAGTLIAMFIMRNYNVTEERANKIRVLLEERKRERQ